MAHLLNKNGGKRVEKPVDYFSSKSKQTELMQ